MESGRLTELSGKLLAVVFMALAIPAWPPTPVIKLHRTRRNKRTRLSSVALSSPASKMSRIPE